MAAPAEVWAALGVDAEAVAYRRGLLLTAVAVPAGSPVGVGSRARVAVEGEKAAAVTAGMPARAPGAVR
ncbi:hypothetical protein QWJ26_16085 [Streptomyces sp. CSDS2]|uniref:hypothetical protein n=1 Tax=Streptomyces sp. CSDS2 TaxID=3055051 RepID=UPI0025AFBA46|nr:hypothetical protein [Streptomyces sp. CSDS2]MDN3261308.1 hypothetical protein [Streptomyces sp. CSDS2]